MMTLAVYDANGNVIYQVAGAYTVPEGVPCLEVDVPEGSVIMSVDVNEVPRAIVVPSDQIGLSLEDAKKNQIEKLKGNLEKFLSKNPLVSTVHNGEEKNYSVTKEKQNQLLAEIYATEWAYKNDKIYDPSWNAAGEIRTNDWSLSELQKLLFEIKTYVGPYVEEQQTIEKDIENAKSLDELYAIDIEFL